MSYIHSQSQRIHARPKVLDEYAVPSFWIRYTPERLKRPVRIFRALGMFFLPALLAAFLICCNGDPLFIISAYFLLCASAFALIAKIVPLGSMAFLLSPNLIELSEAGIRFHWMRLLYQGSSPTVSWERISHVTSRTDRVGKNDEVTLEFNAIARGFKFQERLQLFMLAPALTWGWLTSDRAQIRLPVEAIASSDDRKRLQTALKKFLPTYRIDPRVADDLSVFIKFDSYTDLWLDKLQDSSSAKATALEPETRLCNGDFVVIEQIGAGGQAVVYRARMFKDPSENALSAGNKAGSETIVDMSDLNTRPDFRKESVLPGSAPYMVVLKEFILPVQAGLEVKKRVLDNIQKEARLWHKLRHPNIARLIDFFIEGQRAYLVLEHVEGSTLKNCVANGGAMPELRVAELSLQMCDILAYLHRRQPPVVHRDFTPDNLILDRQGAIKLIDFNVAMQLEAQTTRTVVGKHSYIPPEQFRGKAVTQSDLYALGATLYYLLTGEDPEPITEAHPRMKINAISEAMDSVIARATSLTVANRYQDCLELKTDLLQVLENAKASHADPL